MYRYYNKRTHYITNAAIGFGKLCRYADGGGKQSISCDVLREMGPIEFVASQFFNWLQINYSCWKMHTSTCMYLCTWRPATIDLWLAMMEAQFAGSVTLKPYQGFPAWSLLLLVGCSLLERPQRMLLCTETFVKAAGVISRVSQGHCIWNSAVNGFPSNPSGLTIYILPLGRRLLLLYIRPTTCLFHQKRCCCNASWVL